jgi:hypothetical protein
MILKTLREGCINGAAGNDLSNAPSVNGDAAR